MIHLVTNSDGTWSTVGDSATICGVAYKLKFARNGCDGPCLTLTPAVGSGSGAPPTYTAVRAYCGKNSAFFAIGDPAVCPAARACGGPAANLAMIEVFWTHCDWTGPGYYCVEECGSTVSEVLHLVESDLAGADFAIISGPYGTEAEALANCGPVVVGCKIDSGDASPVPRSFGRGPKCVTFGGTLSSLGSVTLNHDPTFPFQPLAWVGVVNGVTVALSISSLYAPNRRCLFVLTVAYPGGGTCHYTWYFEPRTDLPLVFDSTVDTVTTFTPDVGIFCPVPAGTITFKVSEGSC